MNKLLIIDGNSLLFRAYFATSFTGNIMRTKSGVPTNAIFAFSNMISKIISTLKEGDLLFVSFDTGKKTFRHDQLESYKAQRKPIEEDLKTQLPIARELLDAYGVYHYELEGHEGDDLAGTVAKLGAKNNIPVHIYTSDKDFLQLIDDKIDIYMLKKGLSEIEIMNEESLKEKMGLTPEQIKDYKGLMGDASDNLKGIPGVGEKTALKLILEYGSLEKIIEGMTDQNSKLAQKIIENQEQGRVCKMLATIETDIELPFELKDLVYQGYDFNVLSQFLTKYEFYSLLKKLKPCHIQSKTLSQPEIKKENVTFNTRYINKFNDIKSSVNTFIMDIENGNYHTAKINGFVFSDDKNVYYLPFEQAVVDKDFISFIEDENNKKVTYDLKRAKVALANHNIELKGIYFDLLLGAYLIDSSLDNDPITIFAYFGVNILKTEVISLFENEEKNLVMCFQLNRIHQDVIETIKSIDCLNLLTDIDIPLSYVLADMEIEGFPLNKESLKEINDRYQLILDELTSTIYKMCNKEFNIASPKQLAEVLFHDLGLPSNKKESTSVDVLHYLEDKHPVVPYILEYRKYSKIISTYTTGLSEFIHEDGKIHAIFNQALTTTGRLSSSEPNLQNISIKNEEGKSIRKAFYYNEDDIYLLSLDYSQVELRILSDLSSCQDLIDLFNRDEDIHKETAAAIFNVPLEEVTPTMRRQAKTVNFGIVYGISDWGLAEQLNITAKQARIIIDRFYERFKEIKVYFNDLIAQANQDLYVKNIMKRRRYINELKSDNYQVREFGKRAAMNAPIQGSAADIIKVAMIQIYNEFKKRTFKSKIVLQIHDELIFKVYKDEIDIIYPLVKEIMENCVKMKVKLQVEGSYAKTWYDCK